MRVLVIESDPEDLLFLREVLVEIGEGRYWTHWVNIEILDAASWTGAAAILARETVDVVLLALDLADSQGIETFRRAQLAAPSIPMILLVGGYEESLGVQLIRDGAQDFLVKGQVECGALAHAMRTAIERHRLLTASRAASTHDSLTGLLNRGEFLTLADRDRELAARMGRRFMVLVAEPELSVEIDTVYGRQRRDLAVIDAADRLRSVAGTADLLARIEDSRFGMTIFDSDLESLEAACVRIQSALSQHHIRTGAAVFSIDRPTTLDALLEEAANDLFPNALAMRT